MSKERGGMFDGVLRAALAEELGKVTAAIDRVNKSVRRGPIPGIHKTLSEFESWISVLNPAACVAAIHAADADVQAYAETGSDASHDALMAHMVRLQALNLGANMAIISLSQAFTGLVPTGEQIKDFEKAAGLTEPDDAGTAETPDDAGTAETPDDA